MRYFTLLATIYAATVGTSSADIDAGINLPIEVDAAAYDERTSGNGCSPDGCKPENTLDHSRATNSRWSCKGEMVEGGGGCWIKYNFEPAKNLVKMRIAFYRGEENTRTLNVYANGEYYSKIESSGETNGYQSFNLDTDETEEIMLHLDDYESKPDEWLSITEVKFTEK